MGILAKRLAFGSLLVGLTGLGFKLVAWQLTGSVALLSDALESIVNVFTALVVMFTLRMAAKPADANHPYGHHKVEFFSAVLEGLMIIVAAIFILQEAILALLHPTMVEASIVGLLFSAFSTLLNAGWSRLLIIQGRKMRSPALVADGQHIWSDVMSSLGVVIGVVIVLITNIHWLDPVIAMAVALHILWTGSKVVKHSLSGLMDEQVPEEDLKTIFKTITAAAEEEALEAHDLRTRHAGRMTFIEFHLVVDGNMTVAASHALCDKVEEALQREFPESHITIHVEPGEKAKHPKKGFVQRF